MRMWYRGLFSMLGVASILALAGCSDVLGLGGPKIVVSVARQSNVGDPLLMRADIGGRRVEVESARTVEFTQGFQHGDRHWISAVVGPDRPDGFCIGAVVAAPLRTSPAGADSLFVMYGGIPEDAVC